MQEVAAEELMGRKWRYHKIERCWLTRDEAYPGPVDVERGVSERGVYLLWDPATWKKVRVCCTLGFIWNLALSLYFTYSASLFFAMKIWTTEWIQAARFREWASRNMGHECLSGMR